MGKYYSCCSTGNTIGAYMRYTIEMHIFNLCILECLSLCIYSCNQLLGALLNVEVKSNCCSCFWSPSKRVLTCSRCLECSQLLWQQYSSGHAIRQFWWIVQPNKLFQVAFLSLCMCCCVYSHGCRLCGQHREDLSGTCWSGQDAG